MNRVVRTLLISDKFSADGVGLVRHPAIDRTALEVSLRGNSLLLRILSWMRISRANAIELDQLRALPSIEKGKCSLTHRPPMTVRFVLPFFISKTRLLYDIKLAADSLGLTRICIDNLGQSVFLAAALPELEIVWVVRSKKEIENLAGMSEKSEKFEILVEVDESLLDSKDIVSNLLDCFIYVIASKVRTPERALELRRWSISEITSPHITVLNIL